ncbi:MAG: GntR family transcriptional regulator [Bacillota bacterium]
MRLADLNERRHAMFDSSEMDDILKTIRRENYQPARDIVYSFLRKAILEGLFSEEQRLIELDLAEKLGVSRTPVREALRKLELEGLAEHQPRKGMVVKRISPKELEDIFGIRAILEGYAARLASQFADDEDIDRLYETLEHIKKSGEGDIRELLQAHAKFNEAFYLASKNQRLFVLLSTYSDYFTRTRRVSLMIPGRREEAWMEHSEIVEAIANKESSLAEHLAIMHVEKARTAFLREIGVIQKSERRKSKIRPERSFPDASRTTPVD